MPHPLFGPEVRVMLEANDTLGLKEFCESLHPSTVAETLAEDFTVEEAWRALEQTSIREQATIFEYFPDDWQEKMVDGTGRAHMARLIEQMSHDDRADLLRRLARPVAEGLLRLVDEADRRDIATLMSYPGNTVGALMTTDYAWLPPDLTVAEAIERLRQQAPDSETIYYVYILEEPTRVLRGIVSLRDLILGQRTAHVGDLMKTDAVTLLATDDRETAARRFAEVDLIALPVVDAEGRMLGIVTHDDVIDVIQEEATEDLQRQAAVGPITENYLEAGFTLIWRNRAFWLACLFGAEMLTFTAMTYFEDAIAAVVVLSLFVPLCISTGGNSGSQAATLITRSLALGHVALGDWVKVLRRELFMGIALGLTLGFIGFFRGALTPDDVRSGPEKQRDAVTVRVPHGVEPEVQHRDSEIRLVFPPPVQMLTTNDKTVQVSLPKGEEPGPVDDSDSRFRAYQFPPGCTTRTEAVSRWLLALVIAFSVAAICLWGTMVGAMLPLIFRRLGVDPGIASSPFVATFVDVTGIVIFFSIAKVYLL
jgi:magnesium transporter